VKAMEKGDWNVLAGGFFPEFSLAKHVVKPFEVPADWARFAATDWGSSKPFATAWYAVAQDEIVVDGTIGNRITIPRGALVCYREWYGCEKGRTNVGLKKPVEWWASGVLRRQRNDPPMSYHTVDTSMFDEDGGPSLAERAMKVREKDKRLVLRPADKRRIPGWNQLRHRLQGDDEDGPAYLFYFDTCADGIRCLEQLLHDELKPEDADTDGEDHTCDRDRYACMSRPRVREVPAPGEQAPKAGTMDWIMGEAWKKNRALPKRSTYRME
jgi:hypothetical protein